MAAIGISTYDTDPWDVDSVGSFRNTLEGWAKGEDHPQLHNLVHVWIGGSMLPASSPNDPVFWVHHCNTDRLWYQWMHTWLRARAAR
jgi:tyrosinase